MDRKPSVSVAADRTHPEIRLPVKLALAARQLKFDVPALAPGDRDFLDDLAREESRYPMRALVRLIAIARTARRDEVAEALAEIIRGEIRAGRMTPEDVFAAFESESLAQVDADMAQWRFERRRSKSNAERAVDLCTRHIVRLRSYVDAVVAVLPTLSS